MFEAIKRFVQGSDSHFTFEGTTLKEVRKIAAELSRCAGSFKQEERAEVFGLASQLNHSLIPNKLIHTSDRFLNRRFGQGSSANLTPTDIELSRYKTAALEFMVQCYLMEAFGGPQNPPDPRIVQFHKKIPEYPLTQDGAYFISEVAFKTPVNLEAVKKMPEARTGIRFNDSVVGQQILPIVTGSAYRETCFQKGKEYALKGIDFSPTMSLLDYYRFCVRHEPQVTLLLQPQPRERLIDREVARAAFFSGVLDYAFLLTGQSLLHGLPYGDDEIVDLYNHLALGVEIKRFPEGLIQKLESTETFARLPDAVISKVLPEVESASQWLNAHKEYVPDMKLLSDVCNLVLYGYKKAELISA